MADWLLHVAPKLHILTSSREGLFGISFPFLLKFHQIDVLLNRNKHFAIIKSGSSLFINN